ncbi:MAG: hypothetical protein ACI30I_06540 [Parabacteroides sp.]
MGHNVQKPLIKGKMAREVREAALKSTATKKEMQVSARKIKRTHTFVWE